MKHLQPGGNGARRSILLLLGIKQRHQPIADVVVNGTTVPLDRARHLVKVAVEQVNDVIRRQRFSEGGKVADVHEQNHHRALDAGGGRDDWRRSVGFALDLIRQLHIFIVENKATQFDVAGDPRLARQTNSRAEHQPFRQNLLLWRSSDTMLSPFENEHPARRAARMAAADTGLWDSRAKGRGENGFLRRDLASSAIGENLQHRHGVDHNAGRCG
jgi:hypothetical protein